MRTLAVVLALLCATASAECRQDRRDRRVNRLRDECGGVSAPAPVDFLFAGESGAGMGAECACGDVTTPDGGAVTTSRTTPAYCIKQDFTHVLCAANKVRAMSGRVDQSWLGVAAESQRQNLLALDSCRDFSVADWTKTNMSCTKTATGVDGAASSASTCTSSAANGTVAQATVLSAAQRAASIYARRRTGTGAVSISVDGSTYYDITSFLSSSWKRIVPYEGVGCSGGRCLVVPEMFTAAANPVIAVKFATSGDALDFDLAQVEAGTYATTPIDANGTNLGYRTGDGINTDLVYDTSRGFAFGLTTVSQGNFASNVMSELESNGSTFVSIYNNSTSNSCVYLKSGAGPTATTTGAPLLVNPSRVSCGWNGTDTVSVTYDGGTATGVTAAAGFTSTVLTVGGSNVYGTAVDGVIRNVCFSSTLNSCSTIDTGSVTYKLGYIGDSISAGVSGTWSPAGRITEMLGTSWSVVNGAVGGATTADCLARFQQGVFDAGITHLTVLCGVNDMIGGSTAAVAWPNLQTMFNTARTGGVAVFPQFVLGCDGGSGCGAVAQNEIQALNGNIADWCADAGISCIDSRPRLSPNGTIPTQYNFGDQIHLNNDGSKWLAAEVRRALP